MKVLRLPVQSCKSTVVNGGGECCAAGVAMKALYMPLDASHAQQQARQDCYATCAPLCPHKVRDPNVEQSQLKRLSNVLLQQSHKGGPQQADLGWVIQLGVQQGVGHGAGRRGAAPARAPVSPLECEGTGTPPSLLQHHCL